MTDEQEAALKAVRKAAMAYDREVVKRRDAFFLAVMQAAETCSQTDIAAACGRSVTRINQIVRGRSHSRR